MVKGRNLFPQEKLKVTHSKVMDLLVAPIQLTDQKEMIALLNTMAHQL
jgi:hypothetical protein